MTGLVCRKATELTTGEKRVFADHLARQALGENIWDLFEEWIARGTPEVSFFYLKVFSGEKLVGLGMFLRIHPFDLRASYSRLREPGILNTLGALISRASSNSVIVSFRNLITSNHTRPFFFREPEVERPAMQAMLAYLKADAEADMVTIVDTSCHSAFYREAGFDGRPGLRAFRRPENLQPPHRRRRGRCVTVVGRSGPRAGGRQAPCRRPGPRGPRLHLIGRVEEPSSRMPNARLAAPAARPSGYSMGPPGTEPPAGGDNPDTR
ncbi:MAG: hypothetical protein ABR538_00955 [Candidatus Binatia bacterium]